VTRTILVVDDDRNIVNLLGKILESHGYFVLATSLPGQAVEWGRSYAGDIDLLLTDVRMPVFTGPEIADAMVEIRPGMAVLYMSGYPDDGKISLLAGQRVGFLQKPFMLVPLVNRVRALLESATAQAAAASAA
jgi:two-component system cell cycle sensor histidine kinase/response regulator CckA